MLGYTARDADEVAGCRALKDKYEWSDFMWTQISEIWSRFHENSENGRCHVLWDCPWNIFNF